ncbi:hypothetical protein CPAR01_05400 [Colletotrichum paranaense]|uniref:BTB domain-containing protein n=1 Tax=Colletotrichum paranaense TaxID=1914294 RepID=A0ABQ9SR54_9PEZI|nr:uncharacterized protein CPAR01_05400 [Colletotrichum paranaense]KAK1542013.1 hypothetical protein CPAR01_05400 [Colletotrichum paranaense]
MDDLQAADDTNGGLSSVIEVQIDPDGDLTLRAGQQTDKPERLFHVCASALRRSSQVWKKMLFGPFKESKPAFGPWVVNLPEDDPEALEIILNIIHANFPLVPNTPDLFELYEIFQMANKYDMIPALKPWAVSWLHVAENCQKGTNRFEGRERAALSYVAWELGQVELHRQMVKELIMYSSLSEDERMVSQKVLLDDVGPLGPPGLLEILHRQREDIINTLPLQINSVIRELMFNDRCCVDKRATCEDRKHCNFIILGSLMRGMGDASGGVGLEVKCDRMEAVASYVDRIRGIANKICFHEGHTTRCNPGPKIQFMLKKITKGRIVKLTKSSIQKMEHRREELGLGPERARTPEEIS